MLARIMKSRVSSASPYERSYGFCRALRLGSRIWIAGTAPIWPDGSCPDAPEAQATRCFQIISEALGSFSASLDDVVRTRMYITRPEIADAVGAVHGRVYADARPVATMVVVAGLLDPRWLVEVEAEAELEDGPA